MTFILNVYLHNLWWERHVSFPCVYWQKPNGCQEKKPCQPPRGKKEKKKKKKV